MKEKNTQTQKEMGKMPVGTPLSRGRNFEGVVIRKFDKRVVIQFERMVYNKKYERYSKSRTKIHARLPALMIDKIKVGDYIRVQECRPLSKIIHFIVVEKIRDEGEIQSKKKTKETKK